MALALTRRDGETVLIGDDIRVEVVECHNGRVRLAVTAPPHVKILRGELAPTPAPSAADIIRPFLPRT